jgi:hypothetical protein
MGGGAKRRRLPNRSVVRRLQIPPPGPPMARVADPVETRLRPQVDAKVRRVGLRGWVLDSVPDPAIIELTDAIVRITSTAICGSELHLYEVLGMFLDKGGHPRPRTDGLRRGGRQRRRAHPPRRPRRCALRDRLRRVPHVLCWAAVPVRDDAGSRAGQGRSALRLHVLLMQTVSIVALSYLAGFATPHASRPAGSETRPCPGSRRRRCRARCRRR